MRPLVSILIPAFNAQPWIAETLRSALGQTWTNKEIIVVDDGSTDDTLAVATQFASPQLRVIAQQNQGAAAARNKALELSQGEYVQYLDADDLLAPDKIEQQLKALEAGLSPRTLLSSAWGRFLYRRSRAEITPNWLWRDLSPAEWLLLKLERNLYMPNSTWLVSRSLIEAAGPWDTSLSVDDDGEYFCRVLLASDGTKFVPEAVSYYRASSSQSLSTIGNSEKKIEAQFRSMKLHIAYLRSLEQSARVNTACVAYLQAWLSYFYPERIRIFEEAEQMARQFGGELTPPRLTWKYSWIKALMGWRMAKRAQALLPSLRWSIQRFWDKTLYRIENGNVAHS